MGIDLDKHMMEQPYEITCSECGADLNVTKRTTDYAYDLTIKVEPCDCQKEAPDEDG